MVDQQAIWSTNANNILPLWGWHCSLLCRCFGSAPQRADRLVARQLIVGVLLNVRWDGLNFLEHNKLEWKKCRTKVPNPPNTEISELVTIFWFIAMQPADKWDITYDITKYYLYKRETTFMDLPPICPLFDTWMIFPGHSLSTYPRNIWQL